jgi:arsenate reductase (thioredoxin)
MSTSNAIAEVDARLRKEFADLLSPETVDRTLQESVAQLTDNARVQLFVPVLAERVARDRLRALTRTAAPPRPSV